MTSRHHHNYDGLFSTNVQSKTIFRFNLPLVLCSVSVDFLVGCGNKDKSDQKPNDSQVINSDLPELCAQKNKDDHQNTITAEVVALEQIITFNRFGAFIPAGKVRLRKDKRPRPLVLRVHEDECLQVKFWNLLSPFPTVHIIFARPDSIFQRVVYKDTRS
jgi:hypothetical protein